MNQNRMAPSPWTNNVKKTPTTTKDFEMGWKSTLKREHKKKVAPRTIQFISGKLHNLADLKKYT